MAAPMPSAVSSGHFCSAGSVGLGARKTLFGHRRRQGWAEAIRGIAAKERKKVIAANVTWREPDFAPSSETPGGYVGQAARSIGCLLAAPGNYPTQFLPIASIPCGDATARRTATPRDVPGSRSLQTDRAAMLQSGSPPELLELLELLNSFPHHALFFRSRW